MNLIVVNATADNESVGETVRKTRHVKERCRRTTADISYAVFPNKMIKALVTYADMMLNYYLDKQGVSNKFPL